MVCRSNQNEVSYAANHCPSPEAADSTNRAEGKGGETGHGGMTRASAGEVLL